jgi:hypothetical protein
MVTPASMGDRAQAIAMAATLAGATWWFARALRERAAPVAAARHESDAQGDEAREAVGAGSR